MSDKLTCTEHIVAFIDVLGTKQKILTSETDSLNVVHNSYTEAIKYMEMIFDKEWFENRRPKVRIFSDNILFYCPVLNDNYQIAFVDTLILIAMVQTQFLDNGYLVRGAITKGSFFADDVMVWGNALVDAYGLESSCALYPRIIIDDSIMNKLQQDKFKTFIIRDEDERFFVDYMSSGFGLDSTIRFSILNKAYQTNEKEIKESATDEGIIKKLNWQKEYIIKKIDELIGIDVISSFVK